MYLQYIQDEIITINDDNLACRSVYGLLPSFKVSRDRYNPRHQRGHDENTCDDCSMSICQVAEILSYRNSETLAECAVAAALDGIPGTLIRKQQLVVYVDDTPDNDISACIDCALLSATTPSLETLGHCVQLPISQINPALILCAKGPCPWTIHRSRKSLHSIFEDLAEVADKTLPLLTDVWRSWHRTGEDSLVPKDIEANLPRSTRADALPCWALLIGIVYDSENMHFVAHIPGDADAPGGPCYLSVHFETLAFSAIPSHTATKPFIRERYRVAQALLCLQQHVLRLNELWDDFHGAEERPAYPAALRSFSRTGNSSLVESSEDTSSSAGSSGSNDTYIGVDLELEGPRKEVPVERIETWLRRSDSVSDQTPTGPIELEVESSEMSAAQYLHREIELREGEARRGARLGRWYVDQSTLRIS
ncbi:hypothetical protein CERSUDRAFT_107437 [Gelatoporia subvermispora B]|uniref:Uncharacterized protein n=1 Tax=Ceriporiopsis subvermispora (strain B) TaxID=914234 RepID=M2QCW6_CERS8|nr:hypothetical protein CERSUDRAFT_107437 [Gelatoporia subvermispora B]